MKIEDKVQNVTRAGVQKTHVFQIQANAQTFKILSSTLYSNKFQAVIRELCCNAWDAHIEAENTKTPFKITFPAILEPTLSIRDFGTGIDPDEFEQIYTTYFFSTKRASNDYTGSFGLGVKSPLSYTNNFNVINFYNCKKYTHVVYLNEFGTPEISLLATEDTQEHNGIQVSFDVSTNDFHSFKSAINEVLQYFPLKPEIHNDSTVIIPDFKPDWQHIAFDGKTYKYNLKDSTPGVLMGNVRYPLRQASIPDFGNAKQVLNKLLLAVDIGDVNVVASREDLEYDKKTITFITEIAKQIYKDLCKSFEADVVKCKSEYEVKCVCAEYHSKSDIRLTAVWNNKTFTTDDHFVEIPNHFNSNYNYYYSRFEAHKDRYLVIMDTKHNKRARLAQIANKYSKYTKVFLADEYIEDDTFRYTGRMLAYKMARTIGVPKDKVIFLSDEKLPKTPRINPHKMVLEYDGSYTYAQYTELSAVKDGYYIVAYRGNYYNEETKKQTAHRAETIVRTMYSVGKFTKPIYIINYSDIKLIKQLKLASAIDEIKSALAAKDMLAIKEREWNHNNSQSFYGSPATIITRIKKKSKNKPLVDILSHEKPKAVSNDDKNKLNLYEKIFGFLSLDNSRSKTYNVKDEVVKAYPMVVYLWQTYESGNKFIQDIDDYIQLVDQGVK